MQEVSGKVGRRVHCLMSEWSILTDPLTTPPPLLPTTVVRASKSTTRRWSMHYSLSQRSQPQVEPYTPRTQAPSWSTWSQSWQRRETQPNHQLHGWGPESWFNFGLPRSVMMCIRGLPSTVGPACHVYIQPRCCGDQTPTWSWSKVMIHNIVTKTITQTITCT